jgi:hypothetical protein
MIMPAGQATAVVLIAAPRSGLDFYFIQMSDGDAGPRGRARSRSFSSEDHLALAEIDAVTGNVAPLVAASRAGGAGGSGGGGPSTAHRGGLSAKTIAIMTKLDARLNPNEDGDADSPRSAAPVDEEAAAEAELAAAEARRRREGESSAMGGGIGGIGGSGSGAGEAAREASDAGSGLRIGGGPRAGVRPRANDQEYDVAVKLLLLGDTAVGKTSLMLRFSEDKFAANTLSTAGVDYKTAYLNVEGKRVKCQIWDTAGQQRFHVITRSYYKNAQGIVLVYDASDTTEER